MKTARPPGASPGRRRTRRVPVRRVAGLVLLVLVAGATAPGAVPEPPALEAACRRNNVGVAWMEQFEYAKAADAFDEALRLAPDLGLARFNRALALFYGGKVTAAEKDAASAATLMPDAPQPLYLRGLIARALNRGPDAVAFFSRVLASDPDDPSVNIALGLALMQTGDFARAATVFRTAFASEPFNATAAYNLSVSLSRLGQAEAGQRALAEFQELRRSGRTTKFGSTYLEQGRLAEAMVSTGLEAGLVREGTPAVRYVESALPPAPSRAEAEGGLALLDADSDGDLDLADVSVSGCRLWINEGHGTFSNRSAGWTATGRSIPIGVVAADLTGDGKPDLVVLRRASISVYRNEGALRFTDVTRQAGLERRITATAAALVDTDHDGDLDLVLGGGAARGGTMLWRNDGTGGFTDVTAQSLLAGAQVVGIVPTDYDERRDVDLLIVPAAGTLALFSNNRSGSFKDVAGAAMLPPGDSWTAVAAGDVNKDGRTDFFLGRPGTAGVFALSTGQGHYRAEPAPAPTTGTTAAVLLDYDNDGLLDLVVVAGSRVRVLRFEGSRWRDVSGAAVPARNGVQLPASGAARALVAADLDGDGDTDLAFRSDAGPRVWRNDGGERTPSLRVPLTGRVSNRGAIGAKVEIRAGSLRDRRELSAATPAVAPSDVVFGLGTGRQVDAVRVLWPSGILQSEFPPASIARLALTEVDRKPSSCPFLFTWNGTRFEFVTDFLGGGELGYWVGPGARNQPDPDEYVRIRGAALQARDGRFELRVTNELEEVLLLDATSLHVVDHPASLEVYPIEGLGSRPRRGLSLIGVTDLQPPSAARDDEGRDVLEQVQRPDWQAPGFRVTSIRGYAAPHALELDAPAGSRFDVLLLTGWTDYAYSSDNVAASQRGLALALPVLEVRDDSGSWSRTGIEVAVPAGRPQTVVVDLREIGLAARRRVRIATNMRIHWDQVRFGRSADVSAARVTVLTAPRAQLGQRGFSYETVGPAGTPIRYDYGRVSSFSSWKQLVGDYTMTGPVVDLLSRVDDRFVVARSGDEIALSFDAALAGTTPPGWTRTFLLHADGYSKEMDLHSASPDAVGPLPFHAMPQYPPARAAARADGEAHDGAPSRHVARPIPRIESLLVRDPAGGPSGDEPGPATPDRW